MITIIITTIFYYYYFLLLLLLFVLFIIITFLLLLFCFILLRFRGARSPPASTQGPRRRRPRPSRAREPPRRCVCTWGRRSPWRWRSIDDWLHQGGDHEEFGWIWSYIICYIIHGLHYTLYTWFTWIVLGKSISYLNLIKHIGFCKKRSLGKPGGEG